MRFLRRSLFGTALLAITAGLLAWAGQMVYGALQDRWATSPSERAARERVFAVNVLNVAPETITPVLSTFGEIRSRRTLELRAASSGEIVWVSPAFEDGENVAAGDLLVRLDDQDALGDRDTALADVEEAEAELRDADRTFEIAQEEMAAAADQLALRERALERQINLRDRAVGTEAAVETAELAVSTAQQSYLSQRQAHAQSEARRDQARTALRRSEIALAEAERNLSDTEIRASFSGVLSGVTVVEGGIVSANERLAELVDPSALEAAFRISTSQYARLLDEADRLPDIDVTVSLNVLGIDLVATGRITRESAVVSEGQTGRLLFAALDDAPGFRPGDFVTVNMSEPELRGVALLPASALDAAGTVLVVGEDERLSTADAPLLRRQGDNVIVRAAEIAGRDVVAERTPFLGDGIRVRAIRPEGAEPAVAEPEFVELDADRRARLVAFVEGNQRMPAEAKQRMLTQLSQEKVPAEMVTRLESRIGG